MFLPKEEKVAFETLIERPSRSALTRKQNISFFPFQKVIKKLEETGIVIDRSIFNPSNRSENPESRS